MNAITITREQFEAVLRDRKCRRIGGSEGGSSYRRGRDLVYWHCPTEVEYVLLPGYFADSVEGR